ncbi:MAG TPA: right-handed parallel beta-helix repeat-containing protein, partial [Chitinophagaceae bacterium]|nr:right-handed parallel beta-helix repeat-containing protein [Chitinophagaceae bacterium]
ITVFIRQGIYSFKKSFRLDSLDAGNENAPIIYTSYPGEVARFSGGVSISPSNAVKVTDKKILQRIVPEAGAHILQIDLKASGITDFGLIRPKGFGRPYSPSAMELFCNEEAMKIARWPNDSLVPIGKVLDPGSIPRDGDYSHRGGQFTYDLPRPARWIQANDSWISGFFRHGYADDAVKIAKLDTANKTITTAQETLYGFEGGKIFQRWYAFNLLEEIDQPGEYYIDRENGTLFFYPVAKLNSIQLSVLETPLISLMNTSNVVFRNITIECSRGIGVYIEKGKKNRLENCTIRNTGLVGVCIGKGVKPADESWNANNGEPTSEMLGIVYGYMYENTVFNREAGTDHVISGCHIYNTGSGGISLSGGDRVTLEKGNNQVLNCRIHDYNRIDRSYKAGVNIDGVGNIIRNCEIFNCPGSAILLYGNDHSIELNNIHHAVTDGDDMGAIYYGRNPGELGNKIKNNFFHHIGNEYGIIAAVYHDDGACGMEVTGNVFYKAGSRTILIGGGNDNIYRDNIFIDCPLAFHIDSRLTGWAKGMVEENGIFKKRLDEVNFQRPPYSILYSNLPKYFDDSLGSPKRNFIENNVFVNVKKLHNGRPEWVRIGKNYMSNTDPGFIDSAVMDFGLISSSVIYEKLPGFKTIPFEKIGMQKIK